MGNFFWKLAFDEEPLYTKNGKREHSSTVSVIGFIDSIYRDYYVCFFNSSLFFMLWNTYSDCYHLKIDIDTFKPFDSFRIIDWHSYVKRLMTSYKNGGYIQTEAKKNGDVTKYYRYFPQLSKPIIDEIDKVLAKHYGFTDEELDFIINYDIKYRMGDELDNNE